MRSSSCIHTLLIWSVIVVSVISDCPPGKKTDNAQGRCCAFPFVYGGVTYNSCTKVAHSRLWCSLTAKYSGQWANCVNPCTNNPCKNGATCTVTGDDTYSCQCPDGFNGQNCETKIPCPPGKKTDNAQGRCCAFPFVYGGVTYDSCTKVAHSRLWCSLTAKYSGQWANCVNPCTNNPCKNGGTCTVTGDDIYYCQCPDGFEGNNCDTKIPCPPGKKTDNAQGRCCAFPFVYGGVTYNSCTKVAHSRLWCSLTAKYSGQWANCVNPCTNNPCKNGATCKVTGDDTYSCQCPDGFNGQNCETKIPCPPGKKTDNAQGRCCAFPFVYGGVTYNSCTKVAHSRLWCSLTAKYSGQWANCVNPCTNNPCKNGATCTVTGDDTYSCQCPDGIMGENCETRIPCPPGKKTDNAQGRCCAFPFVYGGVTYNSCTKVAHSRLWCSLTAKYSGQWANCVNPCTNNPCKNGATCTVTGDDTYSCQCPDEFNGQNCETKIPCPPGKKTDNAQGRCCAFPFVYGGVTYNSCTKVAHSRLWCSLTAKYSGQWANCVDECASSPCKNGASCKTTADGYSCQPCPAGWNGINCNEDINECESSPCKNGGECVNQARGYSCKCKDGYTGKQCEEDVNECTGNPCANGATCHNEVGRYTCECPAGFEGTNCETDIDECKNNPCANGGTCVNSPPGSYTCNCAEGYKGDNCQEVKWNSEGCFNEHKKQTKKALGFRFATIKGINTENPDIEKVYRMCKVAAEQDGYKIFAIRGVNRCITSSDGKPVDFKLYGASSNCKTNYQGHGVGEEGTNFVYTR
ncbi:uncharacterized protein LOC144661094 isoform X1 [Oculina patagonica]